MSECLERSSDLRLRSDRASSKTSTQRPSSTPVAHLYLRNRQLPPEPVWPGSAGCAICPLHLDFAAMPGPPRQVIYRSVKTRLSRVGLGVVLAVITVLLISPVLTNDAGPPPPFAISLSTDAIDAGPHGTLLGGTAPSILDITVTAAGCTNPATIEGTLLRSTDTWYAETHGVDSHPPNQAMLAITGARVESVSIGLDSIDINGPQGLRHVKDGTARITALNDRPVVIHDQQLPLVRLGGTTAAILDAYEWPTAMTPLWFTIKANIVTPGGYDKCYLGLPELFPDRSSMEPNTPWIPMENHRTRIAEHAPNLWPHNWPQEEFGPPLAPDEGLGAAVVVGSVRGRRVDAGSVGLGGSVTSEGGVRYLCHSFLTNRSILAKLKLDSRISPEFDQGSNPDCSGTPTFTATNATTGSTARIFAAGIIGGLATTLVIEALFLGTTQNDGGGLAATRSRRWRH